MDAAQLEELLEKTAGARQEGQGAQRRRGELRRDGPGVATASSASAARFVVAMSESLDAPRRPRARAGARRVAISFSEKRKRPSPGMRWLSAACTPSAWPVAPSAQISAPRQSARPRRSKKNAKSASSIAGMPRPIESANDARSEVEPGIPTNTGEAPERVAAVAVAVYVERARHRQRERGAPDAAKRARAPPRSDARPAIAEACARMPPGSTAGIESSERERTPEADQSDRLREGAHPHAGSSKLLCRRAPSPARRRSRSRPRRAPTAARRNSCIKQAIAGSRDQEPLLPRAVSQSQSRPAQASVVLAGPSA